VTHDASGVSTNDVVPSLLVTVPDSAGASPNTKSAVPVVPSDAENVSRPAGLRERHDARGEVGAGDSGVRREVDGVAGARGGDGCGAGRRGRRGGRGRWRDGIGR
jgi:hypothetical protein